MFLSCPAVFKLPPYTCRNMRLRPVRSTKKANLSLNWHTWSRTTAGTSLGPSILTSRFYSSLISSDSYILIRSSHSLSVVGLCITAINQYTCMDHCSCNSDFVFYVRSCIIPLV